MSNKSYLQNQSYKEFQKLINYIISENNTTSSKFNGLFLNTFNLNKYQQNITSGVSSVMSAFSARNYSMTSTGKMKFVNPNSKSIQNFYNFIEKVYKNFNSWVGLKNYFLISFCQKYRQNIQNTTYLMQNLPTWDYINQSNILVVNTFDKGVLSIISGSNDQISISNIIQQNSDNIAYQNLTIQKEIPSVVSNCANVFSNKTKRCRDYQYFYNGKWYICRNQSTGSVCGDKSSSSGFLTSSNSLKGRIESTKPPKSIQSQYQIPPPPPPPSGHYQTHLPPTLDVIPTAIPYELNPSAPPSGVPIAPEYPQGSQTKSIFSSGKKKINKRSFKKKNISKRSFKKKKK